MILKEYLKIVREDFELGGEKKLYTLLLNLFANSEKQGGAEKGRGRKKEEENKRLVGYIPTS